MAEKKIDESSLKNKGFLSQRQNSMFSMRLKVVGGTVGVKKLRAIADAAEKYGSGYIHLTSRQQIEVPFVKLENAEKASSELEMQEILGGSSGKKVRAIIACHGNTVCKYGLIDCQRLAYKIDEKYFGEPVLKKFKIAITDCLSAYAKPQDNDFGIMGVTKPEILEENCIGCESCEKACKMGAITIKEEKVMIDREKCVLCGACITACRKDALRAEKIEYTIFVGGSMGRKPRHGIKILELVSEEQLFSIMEKTIDYYRKEGLDGERLGELFDRFGIERYKQGIIP
jgi:dissimilatory sulfite reductase (desulfoviridin) alpha/beta subunit